MSYAEPSGRLKACSICYSLENVGKYRPNYLLCQACANVARSLKDKVTLNRIIGRRGLKPADIAAAKLKAQKSVEPPIYYSNRPFICELLEEEAKNAQG